jgi:uncharacterized membrane protein
LSPAAGGQQMYGFPLVPRWLLIVIDIHLLWIALLLFLLQRDEYLSEYIPLLVTILGEDVLKRSLAIAVGVVIIVAVVISLYLVYSGLLGGQQMYGFP